MHGFEIRSSATVLRARARRTSRRSCAGLPRIPCSSSSPCPENACFSRTLTATPTPTDVKITETTTNPPLLLPYYAAHYRISPEFTWFGRRRGAIYVTGALAVNPYLTELDYGAGFSVSWRYLIFSPLYHLGHSTHLTQGEQVGQIWCVYSSSASATTVPPSCAGAPPAPTTKNYFTGAFALGIGVRIPTTYSSTNK
jgi:hypothetical protein